MAESFFHADVVGGWTDPNVDDPTPGCLLLARGLAGDGGLNSFNPVDGGAVNKRIISRIPPSYIVGADDAFLVTLVLGLAAAGSTQVATATAADGSGVASGPQFTDSAESNLGFVVRSTLGNELWVRLSDIVSIDSDEPYFADNLVVSGDTSDFMSDRTVDVVVVDISNSNVDWPNRQFLRLSPFSLTLGSTEYGAAYLGTTRVNRVYLGTAQIS